MSEGLDGPSVSPQQPWLFLHKHMVGVYGEGFHASDCYNKLRLHAGAVLRVHVRHKALAYLDVLLRWIMHFSLISHNGITATIESNAAILETLGVPVTDPRIDSPDYGRIHRHAADCIFEGWEYKQVMSPKAVSNPKDFMCDIPLMIGTPIAAATSAYRFLWSEDVTRLVEEGIISLAVGYRLAFVPDEVLRRKVYMASPWTHLRPAQLSQLRWATLGGESYAEARVADYLPCREMCSRDFSIVTVWHCSLASEVVSIEFVTDTNVVLLPSFTALSRQHRLDRGQWNSTQYKLQMDALDTDMVVKVRLLFADETTDLVVVHVSLVTHNEAKEGILRCRDCLVTPTTDGNAGPS